MLEGGGLEVYEKLQSQVLVAIQCEIYGLYYLICLPFFLKILKLSLLRMF